jgi:hypothetical protein
MANIAQLKEKYEGEWLAIAYDNYGPEGLLEGELIIHSLDESKVWEAIVRRPPENIRYLCRTADRR